MLSHDQGLSHVLVHDLSNVQGPSHGLVPDISQDQGLNHVLAHKETNYKILMSVDVTLDMLRDLTCPFGTLVYHLQGNLGRCCNFKLFR